MTATRTTRTFRPGDIVLARRLFRYHKAIVAAEGGDDWPAGWYYVSYPDEDGWSNTLRLTAAVRPLEVES